MGYPRESSAAVLALVLLSADWVEIVLMVPGVKFEMKNSCIYHGNKTKKGTERSREGEATGLWRCSGTRGTSIGEPIRPPSSLMEDDTCSTLLDLGDSKWWFGRFGLTREFRSAGHRYRLCRAFAVPVSNNEAETIHRQ